MSETLAGLPNAQLLVRVRELVQRGNAVEAELLTHLGNQQRARVDFGESHMARFHRRSIAGSVSAESDSNLGAASGGDDQPSTGFESSSPQPNEA